MAPAARKGLGRLTRDVREFLLVRRIVNLRGFQFLVVLPTTAVVTVVTISAAVGILAMHMTPAGSLYGYGAVLVAFFAVAVWLKAIDMKL